MNIEIIGAGRVGSALAKQFVALGHRVHISNSRGPDTLTEVLEEIPDNSVTATADHRTVFSSYWCPV